MSATQWISDMRPVLCLGAACLLTGLGGCGKSETEERTVSRPALVVKLDETAMTVRREYPATVEANEKAVMAFKVSGPLIALPVKENQEVEEGATLARIDPRDYENAVMEAEAARKEAEAGYAVAISKLDAARAAFAEAQSKVNRNRPLAETGTVSMQDFEVMVATRDVKEQAVEASKKAIEAAQAQVDSLLVREQVAKDQLEDATLKAPFAGVVAVKFVENFENVQEKEPIVEIHDTQKVEVVFDIPESEVARFQESDREIKTFAEFDTLPGKEYPLEFKEFSPKADPATQTYRATFTTDRPPVGEGENLAPGMSCTVVRRVPVAEGVQAGIFAVPSTALLEEGEKSYVWLAPESSGGNPQKVEVSLGEATGADVLIQAAADGPKLSGRSVIVAGIHSLSESDQVRPFTDLRPLFQ